MYRTCAQVPLIGAANWQSVAVTAGLYFYLIANVCGIVISIRLNHASWLSNYQIKWNIVCLFVLRFHGPVNPMGSCRAQSSLPNHTFTGQAKSTKQLTNIVYILSPETDNFLNQRRWENNSRKYFMISLYERMLPTQQGSSPQPPDHQADTNPTEPPRLAMKYWIQSKCR